jgi:hypothetical protein
VGRWISEKRLVYDNVIMFCILIPQTLTILPVPKRKTFYNTLYE